MEGLMMDFPLTLTHLLRRAETFFGDGEIVTRLPDKSFHRTTHGETLRRARQLSVALRKAGLERGDRVATLCGNQMTIAADLGFCGGFCLNPGEACGSLSKLVGSPSMATGSLCAHQMAMEGWWPSRSTASSAWRMAWRRTRA